MSRRASWALACLIGAAGCEARATLTPQYPLSRTQEEPFRERIPDEQARPTWSPPTVEQFTLDNGVRVYFVPLPASGTVSVRYVNRRINSRDPRLRWGLPTLLASMLSRGTTTHPGQRHADAVEALGASFRVSSAVTGLYAAMTTAPTTLRPATQLLAEAITQPELAESEFTVAQRQRRARRRASGRGLVGDELALATLFGPQHPFAMPVGGNDAQIASLTINDVRQLRRERLVPQHSAIAVAGDVTRTDIEALLRETFGRWTADDAREFERAPAAQEPRSERRAWQIVDTEAMTANASVTVAWPMVSLMDPAFADALVLAQVLGGAGSGLFDRSLRERANVTYGVDVSSSIALDGGFGLATTVVATEEAPRAAASMMAEIERLRTGRVARGTIRSIRLRLRNQFLSQFETVSGMSDVLSTLYAFELGPESWTRHMEMLDAVTPLSLRRAAQRLLAPERLSVTIVGNRRVFEAQIATIAPAGYSVFAFVE